LRLAIYNEEQEYHSDLESFCDMNCLLQILRYYGVRKPLLYFDTAPNIKLSKDELKPLGYDVKFNVNWFLEPYLSKIHKYFPTDKTREEVWLENKAILKEGYPIATGIDIFHLDYSSNYHTFHSNHKCILCGYTEDDKNAIIIDHYDWKFKGNAPLEQFLLARGSVCPRDESPYSGVPIKNEWIILDESNWSIHVKETFKNTIDRTCRFFYESELTNYSTEYYGMSALQKIYELYLEHADADFKEKAQLISNCRVIFLFLYTQLKLFRYYMEEASEYIKLDSVSSLIQSLNNDIEQWRKTVVVMLKGTVSVTDHNYRKIANKMKELIDLEQKRHGLLTQISTLL